MRNAKYRSPLLALRAAVAFVLLLAVVGGVYLLGFRSWRKVATWVEDSDHTALVYGEETYTLVGEIGKKGLTLKKYPIDKVLGQVADDGSHMTTEEVTFPEETEEGETLKVTPPDGTPTLPHEHTYILYSVEKQEEHLLVLEKNGKYYLYKRVQEPETLPDTSG